MELNYNKKSKFINSLIFIISIFAFFESSYGIRDIDAIDIAAKFKYNSEAIDWCIKKHTTITNRINETVRRIIGGMSASIETDYPLFTKSVLVFPPKRNKQTLIELLEYSLSEFESSAEFKPKLREFPHDKSKIECDIYMRFPKNFSINNNLSFIEVSTDGKLYMEKTEENTVICKFNVKENNIFNKGKELSLKIRIGLKKGTTLEDLKNKESVIEIDHVFPFLEKFEVAPKKYRAKIPLCSTYIDYKNMKLEEDDGKGDYQEVTLEELFGSYEEESVNYDEYYEYEEDF